MALQLAGLGRNGNSGRRLDLCFFYLDDGILAGDVVAVSEALQLLQRACPELGLTLQLSKSELVVLTNQAGHDLHNHFPRELLVDDQGNSRVFTRNFEFLDSPIGSNTLTVPPTLRAASKRCGHCLKL